MAGALMAQPVGLLLGGLVVNRIGFQGSVIALAAIGLAVGALLALSPVLRQLDAIAEEPDAESEPEALIPGVEAVALPVVERQPVQA